MNKEVGFYNKLKKFCEEELKNAEGLVICSDGSGGIFHNIVGSRKEYQNFSEFKNMINNWYYDEYKEGNYG